MGIVQEECLSDGEIYCNTTTKLFLIIKNKYPTIATCRFALVNFCTSQENYDFLEYVNKHVRNEVRT